MLGFIYVGVGLLSHLTKAFDEFQPVVYPKDYCQNIQNGETFDFIVVGAGPAGSSLARRLSENPKWSILLIEAGGPPPPISDIPGFAARIPLSAHWLFAGVDRMDQCQGYELKRCPMGPGKVLGGSSTVNQMLYVRGNKDDYDGYARKGNTLWSYKKVLPYFKKLENFVAHPLTDKQTKKSVSRQYHGKCGPQTISKFPRDPQTEGLRRAIVESIVQNGLPFNIDTNGPSQIGVTELPGPINRIGYRQNTAKSYLLNIPKNLKVCQNSIVRRVLLANKTAIGVEFFRDPNLSENNQYYARKEVILSAGSFGSPPILERSGIGNKLVLDEVGVPVLHELPGVGNNHYEQFISLASIFESDFGTNVTANPLSNDLAATNGFFNSSNMKDQIPDLQFTLKTYVPEIGVAFGYTESIRCQLDAARNPFFFGCLILVQDDPGSIHIDQTTDPRMSPRIVTNQFKTQHEKDLIVKCTRWIRKVMSGKPLKNFNIKPLVLSPCDKYAYNSQEEILCGMNLIPLPLYHNTGVCKMGPSTDPMAVVNQRLQVYGLQHLRVIDSSILPQVPRGNTEMPSIMVGERGADIVKEDYGFKPPNSNSNSCPSSSSSTTGYSFDEY